MKQIDKFTPEYKKALQANKKDIQKYLENKTGYKILIGIECDKTQGYLYSCKISLDNEFSKFAKWVLHSTGKQNIKKELLENIAHFDFQNMKIGGTTKNITKRVKSSALKIECCGCGEEVNVNEIHRNMSSPLFKSRSGYCYMCFNCSNTRAAEILRDKDANTALVFLCGIYDRPYVKSLADEVIAMCLSPVETFGQYFRRLNLVHSVKGRGSTFSNSDTQF